MTDIEIAQAHEMKKIVDVAAKAGIDEKHLELYGNYKAKLDLSEIRKLPRKAKLILVTAISPTPAGEGKTTTSVGLADAMNALGKKTMLCLREPSLGKTLLQIGNACACPQEPRRRGKGRPEPAQPRSRQGRCLQPDPPYRQPEKRLWSAGGGGHQRLPHGHQGRVGPEKENWVLAMQMGILS